MSSIIEGYNYDIFISYRQKDNKGDRWVSEFVEALETELESTFKEEISVYFDINPHDGLLETHDVDESLKEKLRCLIFIPIISRTYCDPKSFAWQHEFEAFIRQASQDRFGLKIKLQNGNVASRVLPVRIHDLISEDIKLCESALSGVLRGIEFIYKSPGVNRPLRLKEDNPHDNLNHTIYRDQINKTANAISEIICAMKGAQAGPENKANEISDKEAEIVSEAKNTGKKVWETIGQKRLKTVQKGTGRRVFTLSSLAAVIAVSALLLFSSGSTLPFTERDWIVITDFENLTGNPVFDNSLYTAFSLTASQSRYINVFPRSRMIETLKRMEVLDRSVIDEKTGREIAEREGIRIYLVPGVSKIGEKYVITSKIQETASGNILKSEIFYAESESDILNSLDELSRKIRRDLGESRYKIATQDRPLKKVTTSSLEALKLYSLGIDCHIRMDFECARDYYRNALKIDTGFTSAKASLGNVLIEHFEMKEGCEILDKAVRNVDNLTERERLGILAFHAMNVEKNYPKGIEYARTRVELYPDDPSARNNLAYYYLRASRYEEALEQYKETVRIAPDMILAYGGIIWTYLRNFVKIDSALLWADRMIADNPQNPWGYFYKGSAYACLDNFTQAEAAFRKAHEIYPDFVLNDYRLAHILRLQGRNTEAIEILKKILERHKDEASAYFDMGINYEAMGNKEEAMKNYSFFRKIAEEEWTKEWPDYPATYISLAAISARTGDKEYSEKMLEKAMGLDSTLHERYAEVLCAQGKIPEALDETERALKQGYRDLFWLKINPEYKSLQNEPRFRNLLYKYFNNATLYRP
jgi:tetratricopeptide (TPR) repeat protein